MKSKKNLIFLTLITLSLILTSLNINFKKNITYAATTPGVSYRSHCQAVGWQPYVSNGTMSGTSGYSYRLEAFNLNLTNAASSNTITYRSYVNGTGWQGWKKNGAASGTSGEKKAITAVEIKLSGDIANNYDVYYQVHKASLGWTGWKKNGETAGSSNYTKQVEAIQIMLVSKGSEAPANLTYFSTTPEATYDGHVQSIGWQNYAKYYAVSGTTGLNKRLEAYKIKTTNTYENFNVEYSSYVQGSGWSSYTSNDAISGTTGQSKAIYSIKVRLSGYRAALYNVYYRTYTEADGWDSWKKNDVPSGNAAAGKQIEAFQVVIYKNTTPAPSSEIPVTYTSPVKIKYKTHVQSYGWQAYATNTMTSGTIGKAKRLEALNIKIEGASQSELGIKYRTHVQSYGWMDWKSNGALSGTTGVGKRLEAIRISLTGTLANNFDLYYRTYVQTYGWTGWAKNGEISGSVGMSKRMEAIQIDLIPKGASAPGSTENAYYSYVTNGIDVSKWQGTINWAAVKQSGVQFAMVRVSYSTTLDSMYPSNINGATSAGIPVGVYCYSIATNTTEAINEATTLVNAVKGYNVKYPLVLDMEDAYYQGSLSTPERTAIIKAFRNVVESNGYKFMLYANMNWLNNYIDLTGIGSTDIWLARYRDVELGFDNESDTGSAKIKFSPDIIKMWQYSSTGSVDGITGNVDMNLGYKNW